MGEVPGSSLPALCRSGGAPGEAVDRATITNQNLGEKTGSGFTDGFGFDGRDVWGVPVDTIEGVLFHGGLVSDL